MASVVGGLGRGAVSALALIPSTIAVYVLVAWASDGRWGAIAAWAVIACGVLVAVFVPASARLVARLASVAGQPVSGFFVSIFALSGGLAYVIGGLVIDEGGAILGGSVICAFAVLPFAVGRFGQLSAPGLWLVYAVVLSVAAAFLMLAYGLGLVLVAPARAAWIAYTQHRARIASITEGELVT